MRSLQSPSRLRSVPLPRPWTLLLTACIRPHAATGSMVARRDPAVRLEDYRRSLLSWLAVPDPRLGPIVVVDNSGSCLDALRSAAARSNPFGRDLEFLSYQEKLRADVHYGYGELGLIDHAVRHSRLLHGPGRFVKCAGRLYFTDLPRLLDQLPPHVEIAVDGRRNPVGLNERSPMIKTELILASTDFYRRELLDRRYGMSPEKGLWRAESLLYQALSPMMTQPGVILRFPRNAEPEGISAQRNAAYAGGRHRVRGALRATARRFAPDLWL
jgi:hypothetical protein